MQMLMGKALTDETFRTLLSKNPEEAAAQVGIRFGPAQAQQIQEIQGKIDNLAQELKRQGTTAVAVLIPIADVAIVAAFS
ncbi:MAG TPA: Os1348 family NHLP clan protein [Verrucomicrobiota bacterium]|nr:Os1348 family NHLP clan protein [Verrucomicrobiota bacterium]